jgi:hypothetical protein
VAQQHRARDKMKKLVSILIALSIVIGGISAAILLSEKQNDSATISAAEKHNSENHAPIPSADGGQNENAPSAATFSWSDLQTDDLKEFVRRLRAVNCPEPTVQDLVLAEVNRRYAKKQNALWPDRFSQNEYWKPYQRKRNLEEVKKNREMFRQQRALQKKNRAAD